MRLGTVRLAWNRLIAAWGAYRAKRKCEREGYMTIDPDGQTVWVLPDWVRSVERLEQGCATKCGHGDDDPGSAVAAHVSALSPYIDGPSTAPSFSVRIVEKL